MKKITAGISILLLLLLGCVEDNPFKADPDVQCEGGNEHPHIDLVGTESGGMGDIEFSDLDPETAGIQDAIILSFDKDIDPSTVTAASFAMVETSPGTGSVQFTSISYFQESGTAILAGTFSDDKAYLLTVTAGGIQDILGNELDPNHNALYDGSPWDDRLFTFFTGSGFSEMRDITPPGITGYFPKTGCITNITPNPRVFFSDGPMDVSQLNLNNFTLETTSGSTSITLEMVSATSTEIIATPVSDLSYGTRYTVRLSAQLADSAGNSLDTNGDGYIWPNEPDLVWDFQIEDDGTTHGTPPTLSDAIYQPGSPIIRIKFEQSVTGDDVVMDDGTFIAANIQVTDANGSIPIVFETSTDPAAVYCLLQRNAVGTVTLFISCNVADEYGNLFDGDNNGLGGTPGEDDWSGVL
ncbi:MAG: Ig-like domain-containing protein [Candidatus Aegiribacteria sp.]|nr:Ig-like domain-containing protein [Candidatus Aegiribacteria sp.]